MERLYDILSYRRAHGSKGLEAFAQKYMCQFDTITDKHGEILAYTHTIEGQDKLMWSCHIDTCHDSTDTITQQVYLSEMEGILFIDTVKGNVLGADDGAGVWLLLEMIDAGVPGTYMFHCGEERGCIGSKAVAKTMPEFLAGFDHAIAFDRRATHSIITHQMGERACSDVLAQTLIDLLQLNQKHDPTGSYTDTAQYMSHIAECVNISIGYQNEHSNTETLDIDYVQKLRDAIISVDWKSVVLPVERDPSVVEYDDYASFGLPKVGKFNLYTEVEDLVGMDYVEFKNFTRDKSKQELEELLFDALTLVEEATYGIYAEEEDEYQFYNRRY